MLSKLISIQVLVCIVWHPICYFIDTLFEDYDRSASLVANDWIKHAIRWDSLFFVETIDNGYSFQKNHAFLPGFMVVGWLCKLLTDYYWILLLVIGKLCNIISLVFLYKTTLAVSKNRQFAQYASICFIFNPASVFFNSIYTESIFTCLVFASTYALHQKQIALCTIGFCISLHFRSNGLFYIISIGYPILMNFIVNLYQQYYKQAMMYIPKGILIIICFILSFSIVLYYPYILYCNGIDQPIWCASTIPNIYGYVQDVFWEVGFMSSYKLRKAFFIFWGIQGIFILAYWMYKWIQGKSQIQQDRFTIGLFLQQVVLFIIATFLAHINCSSRFFSTSMMFYWALADLYSSNCKWLITFYLIEFNLGGLILFTNFLIWA